MWHMAGEYRRAFKSVLTPVAVLIAGVVLAGLIISLLIALGF